MKKCLLHLGCVLTISLLMIGCENDTEIKGDLRVGATELEHYLEVAGIISSDIEEETVKKLEYEKDESTKLENLEIELDLTNYVLNRDRYESILKQSTVIIDYIEGINENFKGNYDITFKGNTKDEHGRDAYINIAKVSIDNEEVKKIDFEEINFLNLDKISEVTVYDETLDVVTPYSDETNIVKEFHKG